MIYEFVCAGRDPLEDSIDKIESFIKKQGGKIVSNCVANQLVVDTTEAVAMDALKSIRGLYEDCPWSLRKGHLLK